MPKYLFVSIEILLLCTMQKQRDDTVYVVFIDYLDRSLSHLREEIFALDGEIEEYIAYDKNSA